MYQNLCNGQFRDVSVSAGVADQFGGLHCTSADYDNDGCLDIYAQVGGAFPGDVFGNALFDNPGQENHFLYLQLVGSESNRAGVGAQIAVGVDTPEGGRTIHRSAGQISSFGSIPSRQEIGLVQATPIRRVEIYWPTSHERQSLEQVPLDACLRIVEGSPEFELIELQEYSYPEPDRAAL